MLFRHARSELKMSHAEQQPSSLELDPALSNLSTEELYRMLAIIDMIESKKMGAEKISQKDLETLSYLLGNYEE